MDDIMQRIVGMLAKAKPSPDDVKNVTPPLYEPSVVRTAAEYLDPRNIPARVKSFGASIIDPLGLPSAAVGTMSPELRDKWRAVQEQSPSGHMAGQVAGVTGMMAGLPAAASTTGGIVRGAVMGGAPDAIDTAKGNGDLNKQSAMNSIIGAIMYPVKRRIPGAP